jgi:uncharacterized protein (TIGR02646 family)
MRFIAPDSVKAVIPAGWHQTAKEATEAIANLAEGERAKSINDKSALWRDLKPRLKTVASNKCWYCESREVRSDNAVDHYRPKNNIVGCTKIKGYWWLAFVWENYRFSCTFCNSRRIDKDGGTEGGKHDEFPLLDETRRATCDAEIEFEQPLLLDPCCPSDPAFLWFDPDGRPAPNPSLCGDDQSYTHRRAKESIRLFHLDHSDVVERRAVLCNEIREEIAQAEKMLTRFHNGDMTAKEAWNTSIAKLKERYADDAEYSATAHCILMELRAKYASAEAALR